VIAPCSRQDAEVSGEPETRMRTCAHTSRPHANAHAHGTP
jgi:hypothetical protein